MRPLTHRLGCMISSSQILAFRARAQEQMEELAPAEISLDGGTTAIGCAGGNFHDNHREMGDGGFFADYALIFRVDRDLLSSIPEPGTVIKWRRTGETPWRGSLRIDRVLDPANDQGVTLGCNEVNSGR